MRRVGEATWKRNEEVLKTSDDRLLAISSPRLLSHRGEQAMRRVGEEVLKTSHDPLLVSSPPRRLAFFYNEAGQR